MVVTVNIPDELVAELKARGVSIEDYVRQILTERAERAGEGERLRTPEQVREWLDTLSQFSDKIPPLPETITREWLYQDHD